MNLLRNLFSVCMFTLFLSACTHVFAQQLQTENENLTKAASLLNERNTREALALLVPEIKSQNLHIRVKALRLTGVGQWIDKDFEEAQKTLGNSLKLSREIFFRTEEAENLYYLARIGTSTRKFEEAKSHLQEAAHIARAIQDKELEFKIQSILTWTYYMTGESFYTILDQETEVYRLVNTVGTKIQKANAYNNLGYDLTVAGTVPVDSAISLMKFANDTFAETEGNEGRWYTLMNLTWQHRLKNDLENAVTYGEKSLKQALVEEDRHAIVEAAFQFGESLMEMGEMEQAKVQYEIGLGWRGEEEDRDRYVFDVYYARFLWESGEQDQAIALLETAVEWLTQSEVFYEMHGRALLASYYLEKGQKDRSEEQLNIIKNPRHDYISLETRCIAAMTRAQWYAKTGNPNLAKALMESWLKHTRNIGAQQLVLAIENNMEMMR